MQESPASSWFAFSPWLGPDAFCCRYCSSSRGAYNCVFASDASVVLLSMLVILFAIVLCWGSPILTLFPRSVALFANVSLLYSCSGSGCRYLSYPLPPLFLFVGCQPSAGPSILMGFTAVGGMLPVWWVVLIAFATPFEPIVDSHCGSSPRIFFSLAAPLRVVARSESTFFVILLLVRRSHLPILVPLLTILSLSCS